VSTIEHRPKKVFSKAILVLAIRAIRKDVNEIINDTVKQDDVGQGWFEDHQRIASNALDQLCTALSEMHGIEPEVKKRVRLG